jgi:hypothetical protein
MGATTSPLLKKARQAAGEAKPEEADGKQGIQIVESAEV